MAIQHRRGAYGDLDPTKAVPGEVLVVLQDDPTSTDGKAAYMAFSAGNIKRMATYDEVKHYNEDSREYAEEAKGYKNDAQTAMTATQTAATNAANSASAAATSETHTATMLAQAETVITDAKEEAVESAIAEIEEAKNTKKQEILNITTSAETIATNAMSKADDVENHQAEIDTKIAKLEADMQDVSIDPDDLGLYQDMDTGYVYPTYRGTVSENGIPLATGGGGGGGGGGGETVSAVFTCTNTTGWLSRTVPSGADTCNVTFNWSSIENELATGDGTARIAVNEIVMASFQVQQGNITINIAPYLQTGQNKVKIRISDTYDQAKTTTFNITSVVLSISSPFDSTAQYSSAFTFSYTPIGSVEKTVYFILDGHQIGTQVTSVSNRQMSYTIPAQTHGGHSLKVYFESVINNETVRSNELYYEFTYVDPNSTATIITSSFNDTTQKQYSTIPIPYQVYNPNSLTAEVTISVNNVVVSTQTVDRTEHSFSYRANNAGELTINFRSGTATKTITITVTELDIDVEAETDSLTLFLSSEGRSNNEAHPDVWEYGTGNDKISCSFSGFNWITDGWLTDSDDIPCCSISGGATLTIPYKPFATDFRNTGKTFEIEFATRNVLDYDAVIFSCMSEGRGITLTAQKATLKAEQSEISTQYKEDEHIRISFVVEKRTENRLVYIYINGINSGAIQYPADEDFSQTTPVNITVGSSACTIDLYCIRVYDNDLTRYQVVSNWIADTQNGTLMLERYTHNNVYDAYGKIDITNLPSNLPYMIFDCPELPQYKGDKKTCSGNYVNLLNPSKSFSFTNAQIDVQGSSSQYYRRKNYKVKFKSGFTLSNGHVDKYAINDKAIPVSTFCFKADVASSEKANNVELARLFNDVCPYKTPSQTTNSKVRQSIDGFPIVAFWHNPNDGTTSFIGCYNFNNDKSTADTFGFVSNDESWEVKNNTSNRVLFKSDDYSTDAWLDDFEARFPDTDPPYEDPEQLADFASWIVTTDRTAATNAALPEPVTYGDVTYTTDNADYRLAKFKAEIGNYTELQSALFYYLFTELFLMVDSRAKNAFPSFMGTSIS